VIYSFCLDFVFKFLLLQFKTFSQRIEEIEIDVYSSLNKIKSAPSEGSTFMRDCLIEFRVCDPTLCLVVSFYVFFFKFLFRKFAFRKMSAVSGELCNYWNYDFCFETFV
jgi:hypothetical protein